jgi:WD40 repeat protein
MSHVSKRLLTIVVTFVVLAPAMAQEPAKSATRVDAFGDPLPEKAVARIGTVRLRHGGAIDGLTFSPGGELLASSGGDSMVRIWNVADGRASSKHAGGGGGNLQFLSVKDILAAVGTDEAITLWDVKSGGRKRIEGNPNISRSTGRLRSDGKSIAIATNHGVVHLHDLDDFRTLKLFSVPHEFWYQPSFSADAKLVSAAGPDHVISIWDVATGREVVKLSGHRDAIYASTFSPDRRYLASGGRTNKIHLWELATGKLVKTLPSKDHLFAFAPDGKTLASAGRGADVRLWDLDTGKELNVLHHEGQSVVALAYSPNGHTLATGTRDSVIRLWDTTTGREMLTNLNVDGTTVLGFLPRGRRLVTQSPVALQVHALESAAGPKEPTVKEERRDAIRNVLGLAPDGKTAVGGRSTDALFVIDLATGAELFRVKDRLDVSGAAFSPDGKHIAVADIRSIRILDTTTGKQVRSLAREPSRFATLAFSPDGATLVVGSAAGGPGKRTWQAVFWDLANGKEMRRLSLPSDPQMNDDVRPLSISPRGDILAIADRSGVLQLFDAMRHRKFFEITAVNAVTFAPDGAALAVGRGETKLELWELASGKRMVELSGHEGLVQSLAFSSDGRSLATSSSDHTTLVWDVRPDRLGNATTSLDALLIERIWQALTEPDPKDANDALASLAAHPEISVKLFADRLRPVPKASAERVRKLIADLRSTDFAAREAATKALTELRDSVAPELRELLKNDLDLETKRRVERLLRDVVEHAILVPPGNELRALRVIRLLEAMDTPESRGLLERLADGGPAAVRTRIARQAMDRLLAPTKR